MDIVAMRMVIFKGNPFARPHSSVDTVERNARVGKLIADGSEAVEIPLMGLEPLASEPIAKGRGH